MNKKDILNELFELHEKYMDLVWYARANPDLPKLTKEQKNSIINSKGKIYMKYTKDIEELEECPDWQHGFNSGMLAAIRYIFTMNDEGIIEAKENFPELYT